jgi:hypothetical protein
MLLNINFSQGASLSTTIPLSLRGKNVVTGLRDETAFFAWLEYTTKKNVASRHHNNKPYIDLEEI